MRYRAVLVHMLWQLFSIGARALAFALFASAFQLYFGIFIVTHWCLVTFWIIQGEGGENGHIIFKKGGIPKGSTSKISNKWRTKYS